MNFQTRRRYYEEEKQRKRGEPAKVHPLSLGAEAQQRSTDEAKRSVKVSLTDRGEAAKQKPKSVTAAFDPLSALTATALDESVDDPLNASAKSSNESRLATDSGARTDRRIGKQPEATGADTVASDKVEAYFEPWHVRKTQILAKFTTSERLSIITGILSRRDEVEQVSVKVQARSSVENKVRKRLELLDELDEMSNTPQGAQNSATVETREVTQAEYVTRIDEMNRAISAAWNEDQRVRALKIVIQCAKLLGSTEIVSFYPSKFVLVTDVLDAFGKLVCRRLMDKSSSNYTATRASANKGGANAKGTPKRTSGKPDDGLLDEDSQDNALDTPAGASVTDSTRETARNWFLKVAVIRELLPRFFVETALMRALRFLDPEAIAPSIMRLARSTRGFGDPLVASYARLYVVRCAVESCTEAASEKLSDCLRTVFVDVLDALQRVFANAEMVRSTLAANKLSFGKYVSVYQPVLDFVVHCIAVRCNERLEEDKASMSGGGAMTFVVAELRKHCVSGSLVQAVLGGFAPATIARRADLLFDLIEVASELDVARPMLFRQLGMCLALASRTDLDVLASKPPERLEQVTTPKESEASTSLRFRIPLLNDVYRKVCLEGTLTVDEYVQNLEVWIELFLRYADFDTDVDCVAISTLLSNLVERVTLERAFENYYGPMLNILQKCLSNCARLERLFVNNVFERFLALFQKETCKMDAFKQNLEAFFQRHAARCAVEQSEPTFYSPFISDTLLVSTLMQYAKALHDSVTVLTLFDDQRVIARLICTLINLVRYEDVEEQLQFYGECRAAFHMLEAVQVALVHRVVSLSIQVHRVCTEKTLSKTIASKTAAQPNRKILAFQHACAAFCFITVPSLSSVSHKLRLYLLAGQAALLCGCSAQAEACFETFLAVLLEASDADFLEDLAFGSLSTVQSVGGPPPTLAAAQSGLLDLMRTFMSTILYVPDNPQQKAHLTLLRKLLMFIQGAQASDKQQSDVPAGRKDGLVLNDVVRCEAYLSALELLLAYAQPKYAYHPQILGLTYNELSGSLVSANFALLSASSNDALYCNDEAFQRSIRKLLAVVTNELLRILHAQASTLALVSQHNAAALAAATLQSAVWSALAAKFLQVALTGFDLNAEAHKDTEGTSLETLLSNLTQLYVALQPSRPTRAKLARVCERVAQMHYPNDSRVAQLLRPIAAQLGAA